LIREKKKREGKKRTGAGSLPFSRIPAVPSVEKASGDGLISLIGEPQIHRYSICRDYSFSSGV
jgi:hypothetical protein